MSSEILINENNKYYIVVNEWLYPTETGHEVIDDFDNKQDAIDTCLAKCKEAEDNFNKVCGDSLCSFLHSSEGNEVIGACITCKNGLDEWWDCFKIIENDFGIPK